MKLLLAVLILTCQLKAREFEVEDVVLVEDFENTTTFRKIDEAVYKSDGTDFRRVGNGIYKSDGTSCRIIGDTIYCN